MTGLQSTNHILLCSVPSGGKIFSLSYHSPITLHVSFIAFMLAIKGRWPRAMLPSMLSSSPCLLYFICPESGRIHLHIICSWRGIVYSLCCLVAFWNFLITILFVVCARQTLQQGLQQTSPQTAHCKLVIHAPLSKWYNLICPSICDIGRVILTWVALPYPNPNVRVTNENKLTHALLDINPSISSPSRSRQRGNEGRARAGHESG